MGQARRVRLVSEWAVRTVEGRHNCHWNKFVMTFIHHTSFL